jgi:hypothetical protein
MSQEVGQTELKAKTQQLLDGPLKHIRAAAIAAALLPLASVAATPASAQTACNPSGGTICGIVFNDANTAGFRDTTDSGIEAAKVYICPVDPAHPVDQCDINDANTVLVYTSTDGSFSLFAPPGTYMVSVQIPTNTQASPPNIQNNTQDTFDSDGIPTGSGFSVTTVTVVQGGPNYAVDFGFTGSAFSNPGTGTPGYWKNHPEAWPVAGIKVGGVNYTKAQIITFLGKSGKDKSITIFASYVSAWLNTYIDNDPSCVSAAMNSADLWFASYPPGSNVAGSSAAWQQAEPWHQTMDSYNNGLLCAPHRQ